MKSCIYEGSVRHRRREPVLHEFQYRMCMMYIDLDELPHLFKRNWLWSAGRPNLAWFRRADFIDSKTTPLADSVRQLVHSRTGRTPAGPIRLLTHFRYFGYAINPVRFYYCFDQHENLESVVAEVTNTPWGEKHFYVLDARDEAGSKMNFKKSKELHVSPFLDMQFDYSFSLNAPGETLAVDIGNHSTKSPPSGLPVFNASLMLHQRPLTSRNLARVLWRYPLMTVQVTAAIYWQALRLWMKGVKFVSHPDRQNVLSQSKQNEPKQTLKPELQGKQTQR